ncbi:MAG: radical SAM protein [Candidatus Melainabacteria bacterium]|nr:radical SAM protein [Candidatus Melainabacteria bacterium]
MKAHPQIAGYKDTGLLNIHGYLEETKVNGPGIRALVVTQGCHHGCKNCQNPETWDLNIIGESISAFDLAKRILSNPKHEGVTYSGGEPFLQAKGLSEVSRIIREEKGLTTVCYSGYTYNELTGNSPPPYADLLLKQIDLLIDGRYVDGLKTNEFGAGIFRGSSNQKLWWLNPSFALKQKKFDTNKCEIHIKPSGEIIFTGFGGDTINY